MKKILLFGFILSAYVANAQETLVGAKLSVGGGITRVNDSDNSPSGGLDHGFLRNPSDGATTLEKNEPSVGFTIFADFPVNDKISFSTGLGVLSKSFTLRNTDGGYSGVSTYQLAYMQIPLTIKGYVYEKDNINLFVKAGLALDLKVSEKLKENTGDGAHFWNLAKNQTWVDPTRGKNGDNKEMALFNPINTGLLLSFGGEYKLSDKLIFMAAITYSGGYLNMINPNLKHNDIHKTKVADGLKLTSDALLVDLGVAIPLSELR